MNECNVWLRIIAPLHGELHMRSQASSRTAARKLRMRDERGVNAPPPTVRSALAPWGNAAIVAVEPQPDCSLLLSWSDATRGHFADQRWVCAKSRCEGWCALTGHVIRRGDPVYKPQRRGAPCPALCSGMILAVALQRMVEQAAVA